MQITDDRWIDDGLIGLRQLIDLLSFNNNNKQYQPSTMASLCREELRCFLFPNSAGSRHDVIGYTPVGSAHRGLRRPLVDKDAHEHEHKHKHEASASSEARELPTCYADVMPGDSLTDAQLSV